MKKFIIGIVALALVAGVLTILAVNKLRSVPEGYNTIKNARKQYEKLDSARLEMTDLSNGERLMSFCFYINDDHEMILDYDDPKTGEHAYSDGRQFYYRTEADGEWTAITPQDEEYIHNIYNEEYRYPYARGAVFFLDGTAVGEARTEETPNGETVITYVYDCEKLNSSAAQLLDNVSEFRELTCVYTISADGCITRFAEKGVIIDSENKTSDVDIEFTVSDINAVEKIDVPF